MTDAALPSRATLRDWVLASRPATLTAAVVPVMVGTAVAFAHWVACASTRRSQRCSVRLLIQIGTNFANDVFDAEKGADTEKRMGPKRAVAAGLITAKTMRGGHDCHVCTRHLEWPLPRVDKRLDHRADRRLLDRLRHCLHRMAPTRSATTAWAMFL